MIEKLEPFATGYINCRNDNVSMKIASGIYGFCMDLPLTIDPEIGLAAIDCSKDGAEENLGVFFNFGNGIVYHGERLYKKAMEHPECAEKLQLYKQYFENLDTMKLVKAEFSEREKALFDNHTFWAGDWGGHGNPDYDMLLRLGTKGLREKIEHYRKMHPESPDWYDACLLVLDGIDLLARRFLELADRLAYQDEKNREIYKKISRALKTVPQNPPYDFMSACQMFYLVFTLDGNDSPGWFDQYMIQYYNRTQKEEAVRILEGLWQGFYKNRSWNLCIGGSDEGWNDRTNALSYEILDVAAKYKYHTPNLTMRCHRNTPPELMEKAVSVLRTGIGMPVLYNDEVVCPALEEIGIVPRDSHMYAMNGCNQFEIQGKSHMGLEDGEVCLLKCLEYALFNGRCLITEKRLGLETGEGAAFQTFAELLAAYKKQVEYVVEITVRIAGCMQKVIAQHAPNPLRSCLIQGCIESGRDYRAGGPLYNHGQILTEGLADTIDSLFSIKHFVFDTGEYEMREVLDALEKDFCGYEEMYWKFRNFPCKFGNDCEEVDRLGGEILGHYFGELLKYHTCRGGKDGIYGGGLSTFNRTGKYGAACGASANGRHSGDGNLADSIGASPGMDVSGPTALIRSVLHYDQKLAKSGFVLQLKFDQTMFAEENGRKAFIALVKTYFMHGGQQITVNVLNQHDLLDAVEHPDRHLNLIVRIGGYSDYFVNLPGELQQNVIARSIQRL